MTYECSIKNFVWWGFWRSSSLTSCLLYSCHYQNQTGPSVGLPSSCLETYKDSNSAAFLWNLFGFVLPSWGRRPSCVCYRTIDARPFPLIPQGPDIYCETEWGVVKEVQFCLIPPNISYLTGKDYEKWDSFNIWWHLNWTFREGTQKNSLQITLFCLHFWEWKCEL